MTVESQDVIHSASPVIKVDLIHLFESEAEFNLIHAVRRTRTLEGGFLPYEHADISIEIFLYRLCGQKTTPSCCGRI